MSKSYELNTVHVERIHLGILHHAWNNETRQYHIGKVCIAVKATGGEVTATLSSETFLGSAQQNMYTPQQTYNALNNYNGLNALIATKLKELYIAAINLDISA